MKDVLLLFLFIYGVLVPHEASSQPSAAWESLMNGKDLTGWSVLGKPATVSIQDSSMLLHMTAHTSRHAFVRTDKAYKDFIFEVEFRRDRSLDSGILFRSIDAPDTAFSDIFGYMVKIDPSPTRLWTGGIFLDFGNGINWLHTLEGDDRARMAERVDQEWNRLRIEAIGERIKIWLNDIPTVHLIDDKYRKGYIAFKIHYLMKDAEKEQLEIAFRNARIITRNPKRYVRPIDLPVQDTRNKVEIRFFR